MIYTTLLLIGLLGLVAQAFLGFAHMGHGHAGHSHAGHGHSHAGHGHAGQDSAHAEHGHAERGPSPLWNWLSPLALFSLCLGAGAAGSLARPAHLPSLLTAALALAGGAAFYGLLVRPLWGLMFRFASTPSLALNGAVARQAEALGGFDGRGRGVVGLTIDGQWVRVLATLEPGEDAASVRGGDALTIISVDGKSNTCRVARL